MIVPILFKNSGYIELKKIKDERDGSLIIANAIQDIPFEIKRVYFINQLENSISIRGKHAHRNLEQVIFCINGNFTLGLDDGTRKQKIVMNQDNIGVKLGSMLWHTMENFSSDCILLIFASDYYSEADYIRDYDEFIKLVNK
jgi:dTDP-4-dehydrorhamnose 3,5-epimerase-like enzyme